MPEIQRTNMGNVVLMLKSLGINDLLHFGKIVVYLYILLHTLLYMLIHKNTLYMYLHDMHEC